MDIPLDKLGAFPILQFAGAFIIVMFGAVMMWRAVMSKGSASPQQQQPAMPEQRWYFEGPIAEVFKQFARVNQHLERSIERQESMIEQTETTNRHLEEILRTMRDIPSIGRRR